MYTLSFVKYDTVMYNNYHQNCTVWTALQIYPVKPLLNNTILLTKDVKKDDLSQD